MYYGSVCALSETHQNGKTMTRVFFLTVCRLCHVPKVANVVSEIFLQAAMGDGANSVQEKSVLIFFFF